MNRDEPSLAALERLATSTDIRDRAFAASALSLRSNEADFERAAALYERIRETALSQHAAVRAQIRAGTLDTRAFLAALKAAPVETRDHFIEEVLDIAYPSLESGPPMLGADRSLPSGLGEILFALDQAELGPGKSLVDLGSGVGKVVLLLALLSGARAYGVERDPRLVALAERAAQSLGLTNAHFISGDITECALPPADVYYLFMPSTRSAEIARRVSEFALGGKFLLFASPLDLRQFPELRPRHAACYWLELYESG